MFLRLFKRAPLGPLGKDVAQPLRSVVPHAMTSLVLHGGEPLRGFAAAAVACRHQVSDVARALPHRPRPKRACAGDITCGKPRLPRSTSSPCLRTETEPAPEPEQTPQDHILRELQELRRRHETEQERVRLLKITAVENDRKEREASLRAEKLRSKVSQHATRIQRSKREVKKLQDDLDGQVRLAQDALAMGPTSPSQSSVLAEEAQESPRGDPWSPSPGQSPLSVSFAPPAQSLIQSQLDSIPSAIACQTSEATETLGFLGEQPGQKASSSTVRSSSAPALPVRIPASVEEYLNETLNFKVLEFINESTSKEFQRSSLRKLCAANAGGKRNAFRRFDTNGNGMVSFSEFEQTLPLLLGIEVPEERWAQDILHKKVKACFKLLDQDHRGSLECEKAFPGAEAEDAIDPDRMSTPEFWAHWYRQKRPKASTALWRPANKEEAHARHKAKVDEQEAIVEKGRRMKAQWRRLKANGKSDARVREVVMLHLPRGTGEKNREEVRMFGPADARRCRRSYQDKVNDCTKVVLKSLYDMRENREVLMKSTHMLSKHAMEPPMRKKVLAAVQAAPAVQASRQDLAAGFGGAFSQSKDKVKAEKEAAGTDHSDDGPSFKQLQEMYGVDEEKLEDLYKDWVKFSDKNDAIGRRQFGKYLTVLCDDRSLVESDVDAWWNQIIMSVIRKAASVPGAAEIQLPPPEPTLVKVEKWKLMPPGASASGFLNTQPEESEEAPGALGERARRERELKKIKANFSHFVGWYYACELRTPWGGNQAGAHH